MMNLLFKAKIENIFKNMLKIVIGTIFILIIIWTCIFLTDFILYKNNRQPIFIKIELDNSTGEYTTKSTGLGYYFITKNNNTVLYIFGKKVN